MFLITWISLVVYCCTLIQKNVLMMFRRPLPEVPPPWSNFKATKITIRFQQNPIWPSNATGVSASTEIR